MTKGRAVILLLVLAGVLWILAAQSWGAAAQAPTGPAGVAEVAGEEEGGHPVLTACAAIIAVAALLLALLGRIGRIVVCGLIAAVGAGALLTGAASSAPMHGCRDRGRGRLDRGREPRLAGHQPIRPADRPGGRRGRRPDLDVGRAVQGRGPQLSQRARHATMTSENH